MTMPLVADIPSEGAAIYYDPGWMRMIETHLNWLLSRQDNELITIAEGTAYKYEGDFFGLMAEINVMPAYWFLLMRMNGMMAPTDYRLEMQTLLKPTFSNVDNLTSVYRTTMSKIK